MEPCGSLGHLFLLGLLMGFGEDSLWPMYVSSAAAFNVLRVACLVHSSGPSQEERSLGSRWPKKKETYMKLI